MLGNRLAGLSRPFAIASRHPVPVATVVLALALALRVVEVQRSAYTARNDAHSYLVLATQVAAGGDYSAHVRGAGGTRGPSAYYPPGYPYLLAAVDRLTGHSGAGPGAVHAARIAQALIGTAIVGLIGLIALELFGSEVALIAIALAAVYPVLIELSSVLVAETLLTALELGAVYAALRTRRARDPLGWLIGCGVLCGLAALAHVNGIVVVVALLFAVAGTRPAFGRRFLYAPLVLAGVTALTLSPWLIRDAIELHTFVPITDESGITLAGTYNTSSAAARNPPWSWRLFTKVPADRALARTAPSLTEPELDARLESRAVSYIGAHPTAPVAVGFFNTLRLLELEGTHAWQASAASIGVPLGLARAGVYGFWLLALLALAGAFSRAARAAPRWLWAVPVLMWLSVVFVNAETPRFREAIEPFVVMLAACGLASISIGGRRAGKRRALSWPFASRG